MENIPADRPNIDEVAQDAAKKIADLPPRADLPGGVEQWKAKVQSIIADLLRNFVNGA